MHVCVYFHVCMLMCIYVLYMGIFVHVWYITHMNRHLYWVVSCRASSSPLCMDIWIYISIYVYMFFHACIYMRIKLYIYGDICICCGMSSIFMRIFIGQCRVVSTESSPLYMNICIYISIYVYMYYHVRMYICIYMEMFVHVRYVIPINRHLHRAVSCGVYWKLPCIYVYMNVHLCICIYVLPRIYVYV